MAKEILLYGATGYTGKLIVAAAHKKGLRLIAAGRNLGRVRAVAEPLGFLSRAFALTEPSAIDAAIKGAAVVLCAAGPFSATSRPMADACLRNGVHYLDITGEIDVLEALAARDADAKTRGIVLLPGVGFDVVPSDCLAAHLKRRLPDATDLKLCLSLGDNVSRGTAKTMVEGIAMGTRVRRAGRLIALDRPAEGACDFGRGLRSTVPVSWGDVSTAFHSTGIPNIEIHFEATPAIRTLVGLPRFAKSFLGLAYMQRLLKSGIDWRPEGPSEEVRGAARCTLVGVASDENGMSVRTRLSTPEGYTLTARTALDVAERVASGDFKSGFQTPSRAYGADYILGFDGVTREDLNA